MKKTTEISLNDGINGIDPVKFKMDCGPGSFLKKKEPARHLNLVMCSSIKSTDRARDS